MRGLVIQQPDLDNIVNGLKTVLIRTQNTKIRGHVALCHEGHIHGFANIIDSRQVPRSQLLTPNWEKKHRATHSLLGGPYSTTEALWIWELSHIQKLEFPIPYEPQKGAGGTLIAFIHPRSFNGVLPELKEKKLSSSS